MLPRSRRSVWGQRCDLWESSSLSSSLFPVLQSLFILSRELHFKNIILYHVFLWFPSSAHHEIKSIHIFLPIFNTQANMRANECFDEEMIKEILYRITNRCQPTWAFYCTVSHNAFSIATVLGNLVTDAFSAQEPKTSFILVQKYLQIAYCVSG